MRTRWHWQPILSPSGSYQGYSNPPPFYPHQQPKNPPPYAYNQPPRQRPPPRPHQPSNPPPYTNLPPVISIPPLDQNQGCQICDKKVYLASNVQIFLIMQPISPQPLLHNLNPLMFSRILIQIQFQLQYRIQFQKLPCLKLSTQSESTWCLGS